MQAIVTNRIGGPEELVLEQREIPTCPPDHILVRTAYAGVNFIDIYRRTGLYPVTLPHIPGSEGSGIVVTVGQGVQEFAVEDRVAWADGAHSYAEYVAIRADRAVKVPDTIALDVAAGAMLQGLTAHFLATSTFPIGRDDDVLIHAGAGGVGLLLTQMASLLGAGRIITTTSSAHKAELSRQAGATNTLNYAEFDDIATELPRAVRALTHGDGVHVAYDSVGQATFDGSLASVRQRGTLVVFGASSGPVPPLDIQRLNQAGSVYLTRPSLWHYIATRNELTSRAAELFGWIHNHDVIINIGRVFPLAEAASAHEFLQSRRSTGKILLQLSD